MRILLLADLSSYHTERWIKAYQQSDIKVLAVGMEPPKEEKEYYLHIKSEFRKSPFKYISKLGMVKNIIKEFNPDIIHAHMAPNYGLLAMLSGFRPYIISLWGPDVLETPRKSFFHFLTLKKIFMNASLLHVDADIMGWILENKFGICRGKIMNFPHGVTEEFLTPEIKKEIKDELLMVSHRKLEKIYNNETIIEALGILKKKGINFRFIFASGGTLEAELHTMVHKMGLKDNVEFTGFIPLPQLVEILSKAHIFVSASLSDSTAVSILEAMATGCVPVVSDIQANREWIINGINGYLFNPMDAHDLAGKIMNVMENISWFRKAIDMNIQIIQKKANWERNLGKFLEKLENLDNISCMPPKKRAKVPWSWL